MTSRTFGFYSAIHTFIVTAVLAIAVTAQVDWQAVPTPPEVLEENKRTGEVTIFEVRPGGSSRVTRTTFFPGTDIGQRQRVVTTSNGSTTISSVNWNEQGEAIAYTEEVVLGTISYAESKQDINWQGKQIQGSRWFFRQAGDGSVVGDKIEQYLSPSTRTWTTLPGKQSTTVNIFHHPSRKADAKKAESILSRGGYKVVLREYAVVNDSVDGQRVISRIVYYYPADVEANSRTIAKLLSGFANLDDFQEADPALVDDKSERSITLYLMDESITKKPAIPVTTPDTGKDETAKPEANNAAPNDSPGRDQIVAALERNYTNAKKQVDRPEYDDNEATRLLKEMESISAYAEQRMLKEAPRSPRWLRFKDIKDRADADIRQLRERLKKTKPEANLLAGTWRLYIDGQPQPGEFKFGKLSEEGDLVNLTRGSEPWITVVDALSQTRIVQVDIRAPVKPPFGQEHIQLRGEAGSNRLEFWTSKDWESTVFQPSRYALVREEKSR